MLQRLLALIVALAAPAAFALVTPLPGVTPQRAPALTPFGVPIAVRVTNAAGAPVADAHVTLSAHYVISFEPAFQQASCYIEFLSLRLCTVRTDAEGIARFGPATALEAGPSPKRVVVEATVRRNLAIESLGQASIELTADPAGPAATVEIIEGNNQRAVIGTHLAPIVVRIRSPEGSPRPNATLYYSPINHVGDGGFQPPLDTRQEVVTDAHGIAALPPFRASWGLGNHEASVLYIDPGSATRIHTPIRYTTTNAQGGDSLQLGGLWWGGPSESGWGVSVFQHDDRLFKVWFVYDSGGQPTWFVQPDGVWTAGVGSQHFGNLYSPAGSPWYAYDATRFRMGQPLGQGSTRFQGPGDAHSGLNFYQYPTATVLRHVTPQSFGRGEPAPITGVGDLWWGGPSQNGWGLAIHEQAGTLFMVWFTYGPAGEPTWFVMPGGSWQQGAYVGSIFRTFGPWWGLPAFEASKVVTTQVGSFVLRFESTARARMDISLEGRSLTLPLERQGF